MASVRKAEFTIRICIRVSPDTKQAKLNRIASLLETQLRHQFSKINAKIVHSSNHVRTWREDA